MPSWRPRKATGRTAPTGSMGAGPDSRSRAIPTIRAVAIPASPSIRSRTSAAKSLRCPRISMSTARSSASSTTAPRPSRRARASTGRRPRRWPTARCCSRASRCACPARTASAAPSRSAIRSWSIRRTRTATSRTIISTLSEEAVLGFEYGYSLAEPNALTMWEAQFGDFANGAQVVFDQFVSSGERKWLRMSGLVCLLPHGYEGQGPEHSSARLERFLQMSAEDNMQVANCTTPANYFHVLRRQLHREIRKPLIMMTPKSLLRHKRAVSRLDELGKDATFHRILYDDAQMQPDEKIKLVPDDKIRRVVLCSGKVYYDLYEEREKRGIDDIYLMRIEQLYPVPLKALVQELSRFKGAEVVWCQEEPRNMGAWFFVDTFLEWVLNQIGAKNKRPRYAGRPASAATAVGVMSKHLAQLKTLLDDALR